MPKDQYKNSNMGTENIQQFIVIVIDGTINAQDYIAYIALAHVDVYTKQESLLKCFENFQEINQIKLYGARTINNKDLNKYYKLKELFGQGLSNKYNVSADNFDTKHCISNMFMVDIFVKNIAGKFKNVKIMEQYGEEAKYEDIIYNMEKEIFEPGVPIKESEKCLNRMLYRVISDYYYENKNLEPELKRDLLETFILKENIDTKIDLSEEMLKKYVKEYKNIFETHIQCFWIKCKKIIHTC